MISSLQELADQFRKLIPQDAPLPEIPAVAGASCAQGGAVSQVSTDPVQMVDYAIKGWHLDVRARPDQVVAAAALLDENGFAMDAVTGVDWIAEGEMEVVYDYFHPANSWRVVVRARVPRSKPEIPTISQVYPGANWHERETHEFFGIVFLGHPNLTPLLLPEDADYHPLRKDFKA